MENISEALGAAFMIIGIILVVFIIAKYNYLIKKAMIEKGLALPQKAKNTQLMDYGCIVLGLGFGLIFSTIFTSMEISEDTMDLLVWGTILIFGALGLLSAHALRRKFDR